mmetsp:Transcript_9718/g.30702  ORF Transcript_9718/g.30702 Transcript_9718/m.30702 type:complete len:209 (-) Transcript_9718:305-931(-)
MTSEGCTPVPVRRSVWRWRRPQSYRSHRQTTPSRRSGRRCSSSTCGMRWASSPLTPPPTLSSGTAADASPHVSVALNESRRLLGARHRLAAFLDLSSVSSGLASLASPSSPSSPSSLASSPGRRTIAGKLSRQSTPRSRLASANSCGGSSGGWGVVQEAPVAAAGSDAAEQRGGSSGDEGEAADALSQQGGVDEAVGAAGVSEIGAMV